MQPRFHLTLSSGGRPRGASRACLAARRYGRGFTLLELMATITILAILLGIGIPSLTAFIQNSRVTSQANGLVSSFHLARSEAIKRGTPVSVTALAGGFGAGWCVHLGVGCGDPADAGVLRVYPPMPRMDVGEDALDVIFDGRGARTTPAPGTDMVITLQPADCAAGQANRARRIEVTPTGRFSVTREDCA
ncbi:MAG: GspH/FimT family pseudopilin [Gammaproteobacteria bacterium]|nr:GspH/FimT family pseudopilin [Gammaproteobacteria bacterium]